MFARKQQRKVHIRDVHNKLPISYECNECGQKTRNQKLLNIHLKAVHFPTIKGFPCKFCGYHYNSLLEIERHMQQMHANELVECNYCSKKFSTENNLYSHVKKHHNEKLDSSDQKEYACDWCNYSGRTSIHLNKHIRSVHKNVRRHKCNQCDFTSYATTALKRHIASIHEGLILRNSAKGSCIALLQKPFSNPVESGCFIMSVQANEAVKQANTCWC